MYKLLEPILTENSLISIPKLVLAQFCRGTNKNPLGILDAPLLSCQVNLQETNTSKFEVGTQLLGPHFHIYTCIEVDEIF